MIDRQIAPGLWVLEGAVNTGMLLVGGHALLIDCCDSVTPARLKRLGVEQVDLILCTQHRRPNVAGAYAFVERGARVMVPAGARALFDGVEDYWADGRNRWHAYHYQPGPQVLARPLAVAQELYDGEKVSWRGYSIEALTTPGATDQAVSYLLDVGGQRICFSGDVLHGPGQLLDIASLQKGFGCVGDYHGYIGNALNLQTSLRRLADVGADLLVPAHGEPLTATAEAIALLSDRLDALWRNHAAISSLNHYFPTLYEDLRDDPARMPPAEVSDPPPHVQRMAYTSYAVLSDTGAVLLIDCGDQSVIDMLRAWLEAEQYANMPIRSVEECWVTHYHDDHVDGLAALQDAFDLRVSTEEHMVEVLEHPERFMLPCLSPIAARNVYARRDGESWRWHEYRLTAYHFPGQTYYHSGLLVRGHGTSLFFAGDSGSPCGIDDHCCANRCFSGPGRGFRRCLEIWRETRPEFIFNQHQERAFRFSDAQLEYMEEMLVQRQSLLATMLPWSRPDMGADDGWVRAYPYEQSVVQGETCTMAVGVTNHGSAPLCVSVEPVLPDGWRFASTQPPGGVVVPAGQEGTVDSEVGVPGDAVTGLVVVPLRVTVDDGYLGQIRHALVRVIAREGSR